jgi:hypothetical protein
MSLLRQMTIQEITGTISTGNSTTTPLGISGVYTGDWEEIKDYAIIKVNLYSDQDAAEGGLDFQQSPDQTIIMDEPYNISAGDKKLFTPNPVARYFRIIYTNGTVAHGANGFSIQTIYSSVYAKPTSHRLGDDVKDDDDAELVKAVIAYKDDPDGRYENVSIQNPLPVDGDSVYAKDIWLSESDIGDFSGSVLDLFDNLQSTIVDSTGNDPKTIIIQFNRTIISNALGLGTYTGDFSNTEIQIGTSGGSFITVVDDSVDATKYTSRILQLPITAGFNAIKLIFHTTDTISLSNCVIIKARSTISRIQAKSSLNGLVEDVTSYRGALDVNSAWVHRKIVNETYHQHTGDSTTPSVAISGGDISITFTSVAGFAIGSQCKLTEGSTQEGGLLTVTDITALVVTMDRPIGNDYTTAADIAEVTTNMAVSGTLAAPEIFEIDPPEGVVWQFTRIMASITDNASMDDSRFGGIAALTNGVTLRATTTAGRTIVFANWKSNYDMKLDMFDVAYSDKSPAGFYGLNTRWTFTKSEVVAELDGDASPVQKLEVLIQDDLTDLETFYQRGQGRVFSP